MVGQWLVVAEEFDDPARPSGLVVVKPGTRDTTIGLVLKAGPECELDNIGEGTRILFEQWAGGRWALKDAEGHDVNVLIMSASAILALVEEA
jgi:co-chaperonin GroES (HSP10)